MQSHSVSTGKRRFFFLQRKEQAQREFNVFRAQDQANGTRQSSESARCLLLGEVLKPSRCPPQIFYISGPYCKKRFPFRVISLNYCYRTPKLFFFIDIFLDVFTLQIDPLFKARWPLRGTEHPPPRRRPPRPARAQGNRPAWVQIPSPPLLGRMTLTESPTSPRK